MRSTRASRRSQQVAGMLTLLLLVTAASQSSCASAPASRNGPYEPISECARDPAKAQRLTLQAADLIDTDPAKAESLLREALTADLYQGPAHNNLGVIFLKQHPPKLFEAAGEFQWAAKLLPGLPDPRMNLALTLEKAGRTDEAISTYRTALEVYPGHIATMEAIARLQLRTGKADEATPAMLREISLRGETDTWRKWARLASSRLGGTPP